MPFKSEAQRKFLWAKHPSVARQWTDEERRMNFKGAAKRRLRKKNGNKHS